MEEASNEAKGVHYGLPQWGSHTNHWKPGLQLFPLVVCKPMTGVPPPPLTCSGVGVVVPGLLCDVEDLGNHVLHPPWHAATGVGGGGPEKEMGRKRLREGGKKKIERGSKGRREGGKD